MRGLTSFGRRASQAPPEADALDGAPDGELPAPAAAPISAASVVATASAAASPSEAELDAQIPKSSWSEPAPARTWDAVQDEWSVERQRVRLSVAARRRQRVPRLIGALTVLALVVLGLRAFRQEQQRATRDGAVAGTGTVAGTGSGTAAVPAAVPAAVHEVAEAEAEAEATLGSGVVAGGETGTGSPGGAEPDRGGGVGSGTEAESVGRIAQASAEPVVRAVRAAPEPEGYGEVLARAAEFSRRGDKEQALAAYEEASRLAPTRTEPLRRIAYIHLSLGDGRRARVYAQRALQRDPADGEALIVLGAALAALGDRAGARTAYQRCAGLPDSDYAKECAVLAR